jgi:adenosylcobyric acid synthase
VSGGTPLLRTVSGVDEGCRAGAVIGTAWHGLLESDGFRRALLSWVARTTGRRFVAGEVAFAAVRNAQLDRLGDLVGDHVDGGAIETLISRGAPAGLPVIPPAGAGRP